MRKLALALVTVVGLSSVATQAHAVDRACIRSIIEYYDSSGPWAADAIADAQARGAPPGQSVGYYGGWMIAWGIVACATGMF